MAIFHFHSSYGSRQGGDSAVDELRYVLRRGKYARGRDRCVKSDWGNLPAWSHGDPFALFEAADRYERENARLYQELEGALPVELSLAQSIDLTRAMAEAVAGSRLPYAWGIHEGRPSEPGKPQNLHWHLLVLERMNDGVVRDAAGWFRRANRRDPAAGGAAKDRRLKGHQWLSKVRAVYEGLLNEALERAGHPVRVTCESHATRMARAEAEGDHEAVEQLLLHPPGSHIGSAASAIERGGPGQPGRPTERGERARAREAQAVRLRAKLEEIAREEKEILRAAVAAARDAGVDDRIVGAGQSDDLMTVIALDDATEARRNKIRTDARAVGFGEAVVDRLRREAEPESPDLGWAAVVEATREHRNQMDVAESAARNVRIDANAVYAEARNRNADPLEYLERTIAKREHRIVESARAVFLDAEAISRIRGEAESKAAGSGWAAVVEATREHRNQMDAAESAARDVGVDPEAAYAAARERNADGLQYLKRATAKREHRIVESARAVFLDAEAISRIRGEAESKAAGSGWAAVVEATRERRERKDAAESAARDVGVEPEAAYAAARERNADGLQYLKRATAKREHRIVESARAVFLDAEAISRIRGEAESKAAGSGWAAVVEATRERRERKDAAESAARDVGVDPEAAYAAARERNADGLQYLKRATAKLEQRIIESARAVFLDAEAISRIRGEAESKAAGSGWAAVVEATRERREQKDAAESAARDVGVDPEAAYAAARERNADGLQYLKRATAKLEQRIIESARAVFLDDDAVTRIRREAESERPGSGWTALSEAAAKRGKRQLEAVAAARDVGIDVDAAYARARARNEDELNYLERETDECARIKTAARAALLDDDAIDRIRRDAERKEAGAGWAAVEREIRTRQKRKTMYEGTARRIGLDIDVIYANAGHGTDPLVYLERATSVWQEAQQAGLSNDTIVRVYAKAEKQRAGTGVNAISGATRGQRWRNVEQDGERERVNMPEVYDQARRDRRDPLRALEEATAAARRVRERAEAVARDAGVDVAAVSKLARGVRMNPVVLLEFETDRQLQGRLQAVFGASRSQEFLSRFAASRYKSPRERANVHNDLVEQLSDEVARRVTGLRTDPEGDAFLQRARLDILDVDRPPETWAERSAVLVAAEALRDGTIAAREAESERRPNAAVEERLDGQFAAPGGDGKCFAALDRTAADWRTKGAAASDVGRALDIAESNSGGSSSSTRWHTLVVETERAHPHASSATLREVGAAVAGSDDVDRHAREVSHLLADRARVREIVAGRSEAPASGGFVRRLADWLRQRVSQLLGRSRRTAVATPTPSPAVATAETVSRAESASRSAQRRPPAGAPQRETAPSGAVIRPRDVEHTDAGKHGATAAERRPEGRPAATRRRPAEWEKQRGAENEKSVVGMKKVRPGGDPAVKVPSRGATVGKPSRSRPRTR